MNPKILFKIFFTPFRFLICVPLFFLASIIFFIGFCFYDEALKDYSESLKSLWIFASKGGEYYS